MDIVVTKEHERIARDRDGACPLSIAVLEQFSDAAVVQVKRNGLVRNMVVNVWCYKHCEDTWLGMIERRRPAQKRRKDRLPDYQGIVYDPVTYDLLQSATNAQGLAPLPYVVTIEFGMFVGGAYPPGVTEAVAR